MHREGERDRLRLGSLRRKRDRKDGDTEEECEFLLHSLFGVVRYFVAWITCLSVGPLGVPLVQ
jgi:hypothetical protein